MEQKKTPRADLEKKRPLFVEIGFVITLAIVLLAFEWKSYEKITYDLGPREAVDVVEEVVVNTEQKVKPPAPKPQVQTTMLKVVDDDVEIEDELEIDAEADENTEVEEYVPVEVEEEEEAEEAEIFLVVEQAPQFPGGEAARLKYLADNIKYPQMARESGIQGVVYITFVVEPDGSVTHIKILRGIGGGCDEEAIRVIKAMPKWKPGRQRNKPVRVQFNMPIKFTLQ